MKQKIIDVVNSMIDHVQYHHFPQTTSTVCCIILNNGTSVIGKSDCAYAEDYNEQFGKECAYVDAYKQVFEFAAFKIKEKRIT